MANAKHRYQIGAPAADTSPTTLNGLAFLLLQTSFNFSNVSNLQSSINSVLGSSSVTCTGNTTPGSTGTDGISVEYTGNGYNNSKIPTMHYDDSAIYGSDGILSRSIITSYAAPYAGSYSYQTFHRTGSTAPDGGTFTLTMPNDVGGGGGATSGVIDMDTDWTSIIPGWTLNGATWTTLRDFVIHGGTFGGWVKNSVGETTGPMTIDVSNLTLGGVPWTDNFAGDINANGTNATSEVFQVDRVLATYATHLIGAATFDITWPDASVVSGLTSASSAATLIGGSYSAYLSGSTGPYAYDSYTVAWEFTHNESNSVSLPTLTPHSFSFWRTITPQVTQAGGSSSGGGIPASRKFSGY